MAGLHAWRATVCVGPPLDARATTRAGSPTMSVGCAPASASSTTLKPTEVTPLPDTSAALFENSTCPRLIESVGPVAETPVFSDTRVECCTVAVVPLRATTPLSTPDTVELVMEREAVSPMSTLPLPPEMVLLLTEIEPLDE